MVININGPETINSTVDFRVPHGFSLKSELIRPKIETRRTHSTSLGGCFAIHQPGALLRITIPVGNMQASKMEACLNKGGQLWIAAMEKTTMKRVEQRKTWKAQLSKRGNIFSKVDSLGFEDIYSMQ